MINLDISEKAVKFVYLGVGSNLGNRRNNINLAKYKLLENNIKIIQSSSFYETLSWPDKKKPKFLNIVLKISTKLSPPELLTKCKNIEKFLGRKKRYKNSPRECDIDIIDYNNTTSKRRIILPHPRMHNRNFVLFPLYELNNAWVHPVSKYNIKNLISSLPIYDIRSIKQI